MEFIMLLLSSLLLITIRTVGASDAVLDVDGNALQRGQRYYVVPVLMPGSGLRPTPLKEPCPLYVELTPFGDLGQPLVFLPENDTNDTVVEGSTLYVKFAEPTECPESTMWKVDASVHVVTGGTTSASIGPHFSRFAIRKVRHFPSVYQFQFCPCSIGVDRPSCFMECLFTLGLVEEENKNLVGLQSNRPLTVRFAKVEKKEDSLIRSAVMRAN